MDPGSSGFFGVEGNSIQNPYDMKADRSVSSYDVPHNLVLSWVYDLPFGKSKALHTGNKVVDYAIGNWQINGLADIRSGQPVNVTIAGDIANTGNNGERPNLVGDWHVDNSTPARWFAKEAFAAPGGVHLRQRRTECPACRRRAPGGYVCVPELPLQGALHGSVARGRV